MRNTQTTHAGQMYDREFVIDYNSFERNDLMVFSPNYYEQKHIYTTDYTPHFQWGVIVKVSINCSI